jgi:ABC-type glycerol-3-phosphate transport system permease component
VFALLIATLMLPGVVTLIPTFILFRTLGWLDTLLPLIVPSWFGGAFYIFLMRQFMQGIPYELEEAARIDGASSLRILWQIIAPLCGPAIATVAIFSFLAHYNDFLGPLLYLSTNEKFTLPLGLFWYQGRYGNSWHLVMAASTVAIAPVIVLFFIAQRYFIRGIAMTGLAGR